MAELQKAIANPLEPFLREQERLQIMLESVQIPAYKLPDFGPAAEQIQKFQESFSNVLSPAFEEFQRTFRELPPKLREALLLLANHGWYRDPELPLDGLWELKKALLNGEVSEAEAALVEYYEEKLEEIESNLIQRFPHRSHIISAAFRAHADEEYCLSIPVLLAQTDGIWKELVGQYLFMKQDRKPRTAVYVEQLAADTYEAALLSPLATTTPLSASKYERGPDFNLLNRHTVLHGEALDYGKQSTALKRCR